MTKIKPKKFFGLHAHDGFSTYDGLGYPNEHFDYVIENGMDGMAITNHGHMNSYAHAYLYAEKLHKQGMPFKFIPGCEMYVHPNLKVWKLDYDIKKAMKAEDTNLVAQLKAERLLISNDEHYDAGNADDSLDSGEDNTGLTIENEDTTKSSKFYDPIKRRHHLVVLPKTSIGLQRLFHLVSRGYTEGFYRFPRVDYAMLKEAAEGGHLMISSACIGGPLAREVFIEFEGTEFEDLKPELLDDEVIAAKITKSIAKTFKSLQDAVGVENAYLELQFNKLNAQHLVNRALLRYARENNLTEQLVVTCDSHYPRPEQWKERELYKKLGWLNYQEFDPSKLPKSIEDLKCELYPKNADQVWETYKTSTANYDFYDDQLVCDAIERTHTIAHDRIGDIRPDTTMKLPNYVVPAGMTEHAALKMACDVGMKRRGLAGKQEYVDQLAKELEVVRGKDFSKYFLTMKAIMDIARENMLCGPGRGSGAGSLINYVLDITDVDPLEYDLLFERFLSPERTEAPDIDSDIGDRDKLLRLLRSNFGDENVIPISNYNTFKLKSLVKDISRFYGIEFQEVNKALSTVDKDVRRAIMGQGQDKNLFVLEYDDAKKHSKQFSDFIDKYPQVAEPIQTLFKQNKALGRHAGGVIVSENIKERMPLIKAKGEYQTPWVEGMNYKHLEEFGWIKFDLLGLETLRIIERAIELILERKEGVKNVNFRKVKQWFDENMAPKVIDFDDQAVYKYVYDEGHWCGVFQCTQKGAQLLFEKAKPKCLNDIAALTSIYRPGPLSAKVDKLYMDAKEDPDAVDYGHPLIKQVLYETAGTIIFQEQIMNLCHVVAGFPKEKCNSIRKNIMKRSGSKAAEMAKKSLAMKSDFVEGSVANGVGRQLASDLYDKILFFSGYGFNRSHAISYAMDSYYCAWMLTHHTEEWMCAYLEASSSNPKKKSKAFKEVRKLGYEIVPLDINYASDKWTILPGKKFMPSFSACKGVGKAAIDEIKRNRPYTSMENMLWNEDGSWKHSKFNKRAMENLMKIKALGSLDIVGKGKQFNSYKQLHYVTIENQDKIKKVLKRDPLIGKNAYRELTVESSTMKEWTPHELAQHSVDCLGSFNASIVVHDSLRKRFEAKEIASIDDFEKHDIYWFVITQVRKKKTKNGKPYLHLSIAGLEGKEERMFLWGWDGVKEVSQFAVCVAEIEHGNFGFTTRMGRFKILS
jgi:DNA polymerase III subunit alpha